jgi:hypothetical protein
MKEAVTREVTEHKETLGLAEDDSKAEVRKVLRKVDKRLLPMLTLLYLLSFLDRGNGM